MAVSERKINEYPQLTTTPFAEDLFLVVHDPNNVPSTKTITYQNLFGNVQVSVTFANTITFSNTVSANTLTVNQLVIANTYTPTSVDDLPPGTITWDDQYLYISVANNTVKRIPLNSY